MMLSVSPTQYNILIMIFKHTYVAFHKLECVCDLSAVVRPQGTFKKEECGCWSSLRDTCWMSLNLDHTRAWKPDTIPGSQGNPRKDPNDGKD